MSREVPFDKSAKCDNCGKIGAYDFMGDYLCPECANRVACCERKKIQKYWDAFLDDLKYGRIESMERLALEDLSPRKLLEVFWVWYETRRQSLANSMNHMTSGAGTKPTSGTENNKERRKDDEVQKETSGD